MNVCVAFIGVTKYYGSQAVLRDVTWTLAEGELAGLIGPSGAGKTTLLRIVAGLERCTSGRVTFPGDETTSRRRRGWLSLVFQDHGLWPHLTAWQHVECVLPRGGNETRPARVERLLSEVRLPADCWRRRPAELSGGEAQRLALARALAPEPRLLLLDEPLAQVDVPLRGELLAMIRRLAGQRHLTVLYVTHSWSEAQDLCRRVAVLVAGRLRQEGPTADVFANPADAEVARLTGPVVEIPGALIEAGQVAAPADVRAVRDDDAVLVRPHQVRFSAACGRNCWEVVGVRPLGCGWQATLRSENSEWSVQATAPPDLGASVAVELVPLQSEPG